MAWKSLDDFDLAGKRVLVRVDINVPVEAGSITDFTRIDRVAPSLEKIISRGAKPIMLAHFGRPKGEASPEFSLAPIAKQMGRHLGIPITFSETSIGEEAAAAIAASSNESAILLENTRFHPGEEKNDQALAAEFAKLGDIYCNDAFSAAHRAHASTEAIARLLPNCAGELMREELTALEGALGAPERPLTAIVGGAKISTKLELLGNLISKVDHLIIGGGMANTFLAALGLDVGKSLCEHDLLNTARAIMDKAKAQSCDIVLPSDIVVAREFKAGAEFEICPINGCPDDAMILDAGPTTSARINQIFDQSKTLVWNGPLGAFEIPPFDKATNAAASHAAKLSREGKLNSVAGGGDTVAALNASDSAKDFSYISTAGGAFLEWLEGKELPGVAALSS